jgi:uncharacterized membrane protein YhfC
LGALLLINLTALFAIQAGRLNLALSGEQLALVETQVRAMLAVPWYGTLLGALERLFALILHLSLSLLVLQVFVRGRLYWLLLAILWHALANALAVYLMVTTNPYVTEGAVAVMALFSAILIFALRTPDPPAVAIEPLPPLLSPAPRSLDLSSEKVENTRYNK